MGPLALLLQIQAAAAPIPDAARPPSPFRASKPKFKWMAASTSLPGPRPPDSSASPSTSRWTAGRRRSGPTCSSGTSPTAIHFGIVAYDRQPGTIHASAPIATTSAARTTSSSTSTPSTTAAAPSSSGQPARRAAGRRPERGRRQRGRHVRRRQRDLNPDFIFSRRGRMTTRGYVVEVRIPFKSLRYPGGADQTVGAQHRARCRSAPATRTRGPTCAAPARASSPSRAPSTGTPRPRSAAW